VSRFDQWLAGILERVADRRRAATPRADLKPAPRRPAPWPRCPPEQRPALPVAGRDPLTREQRDLVEAFRLLRRAEHGSDGDLLPILDQLCARLAQKETTAT
jgi:hypothetical protein